MCFCMASMSAWFAQDAGSDQVLPEHVERIDLLPGFDFGFVAVGGGVAWGVAGVAVGDGVHEDGAVALGDDFTLAAHGVDHGEGVESVDALGVHLVGREAGTHAGEHFEAHRFADGLAAHAVEVVDEVHDQRQAAAVSFIPEFLELVHGGKAQGFPGGPATGGGVADVADDDAGAFVDVLEEGRADGDVSGAADDGVVGHDAEGGEEGVHGAAESAVEAKVFGEDFGEGAVDEEIDGEIFGVAFGVFLNDAESFAAEVIFHGGEEGGVIQLLDGGQTFGEDFAMGAVGAVDVVVGVEQVHLTDGGGFLADGEVGGAAVVVFDIVELCTGFLDGVEHEFEAADDHHVANWMRRRSALVKYLPLLSSSAMVRLYWLTGMGENSMWLLARTSSGTIIRALGTVSPIKWLYQLWASQRPRDFHHGAIYPPRISPPFPGT